MLPNYVIIVLLFANYVISLLTFANYAIFCILSKLNFDEHKAWILIFKVDEHQLF
jgi:hypothetical protein